MLKKNEGKIKIFFRPKKKKNNKNIEYKETKIIPT